METVFLTLLNMSITASWTALAVILLRLLLKKANKALVCALWTLVGLRLICPLTFESVLSLIPSTQTVPQDILYAKTPAIDSGVTIINNTFNPAIAQSLSPQPMTSINPMQVVVILAANVWVLGMIVMLLYMLISYLHIRRKVAASLPTEGNVYLCDNISSPFILGVIRPRIYLPATLPEESKAYVIAHEQAHLKRHDHWWKPLGFLLLSVYWFNPVMWVAYVLLCRDIELACDERVIKDMDKDDTAAYAQALLHCSAPRKIIAACPLAFGEVGVKNRIKAALHYKKPAFWITVIAIVASIVLTVCFLTNPSDTSETNGSEFDGLQLAVDSFTMTETGGELTIRWHNDSDETLMFGESFTLYREENGKYVDCYTLEEAYFNAIGCELPAGSFRDHTYDLSLHDLSKSSTYRFESYCTVSDGDGKQYRVWIDFEIPEDALTPPPTPYITYTMVDCDEPVPPSISFSEDAHTFWFHYSALSSHIGHGTYERDADALILHDENGDIYTFIVYADTLIFDAERSSPLPAYQLGDDDPVSVPDGTIFKETTSSTTTTTVSQELTEPSVTYDEQNDEYWYDGPYILDEHTARAVADAIFLQNDPTLSKDYPTLKVTYHADSRDYTVTRVNAEQETGASAELNTPSMFGTGLKIENVKIRNKMFSAFTVTSAEQAQAIGDAIMSSIYSIYGRSDRPMADVFPEVSVMDSVVLDSYVDGWFVFRQDADGHSIMITVSEIGEVDGLLWSDIEAAAPTTTVSTTTSRETTARITAPSAADVSYYLETEFDEYPKNTKEIEIIFGREDGEGFSYDPRYKLYRLQNGEWEQVALKPTVTFHMIMMQVEQRDDAKGESDAKAKLTVDLTSFTDPIDVGTYKIEKEFGSGVSAAVEFVVY